MKHLLSAVAAIVALLAAGVFLTWRRATKQSHSLHRTCIGPMLNTLFRAGAARKPELSSQAEPLSAGEDLALVAESIADPSLKKYLIKIAGRVHAAGPHLGDDAPFGFIEEIVDRLDDLRAIRENQPNETSAPLDNFVRKLTEVLHVCGVELLHSDHWDPGIQRAIQKKQDPEASAVTILRFGSTGIRRHGELLRKQEVVLSIPISELSSQRLTSS